MVKKTTKLKIKSATTIVTNDKQNKFPNSINQSERLNININKAQKQNRVNTIALFVVICLNKHNPHKTHPPTQQTQSFYTKTTFCL